MTTPTPTPEKQNSTAAPNEETPQSADANTSQQERDGFFRMVRRVLHEPHPSEAKEIVIMPGEAGDGTCERD